MKKLFRMTLAALLLFTAAGCQSDEDPCTPFLDPTYGNMAGTWRLSAWNGVEQGDSPDMYIIFDRKEQAFSMYQNHDSGKSRYITGSFELVRDKNEHFVIKGIYDHASGFWSHDYFITAMTASQMTWIATDNPSDVSVYTRCDAVPEEIINGTRAL